MTRNHEGGFTEKSREIYKALTYVESAMTGWGILEIQEIGLKAGWVGGVDISKVRMDAGRAVCNSLEGTGLG